MKESKVLVKYGKFEDFVFPKTIYKYRTWSDKWHKRFLTEREVFLASPETFEDELDCHNPTRFDLLTKKQIYEYFLWSSKEQNPHFSRQQHKNFAKDWAKNSLVNNKEHVEKHMKESIRLYYEREGILSLTENWNNQAMWDKYADFDKGFCIGYNSKELFRHLGGGGPVTYTDKIPIIMPEPFMEFHEAVRNRIYYKLNKWSFEEEYRASKFWPNPATISDRQIKIPASAFKRIILGNNISDKDRNEIEDCVINSIGKIEIIERKNANITML